VGRQRSRCSHPQGLVRAGVPRHDPRARIGSPLGRIHYRHLKTTAFFGYRQIDAGTQPAYIATPEKALLDLVYLTPGSAEAQWLAELRLQRPADLDIELAAQMARRIGAPRLFER
jgi:hypothetical protein